MRRSRLRTALRRVHVWLGWLVGVPLLFWTVSGVVMVWKPIDEVRGSGLLRPSAPLALTAPPVPPTIAGMPLTSLTLEPRAAGPRWVAKGADGTAWLADPASGKRLPSLSAADAAREVTTRYTGGASIATVTRTDPRHPPIDLRKPIAAWAVMMTDGTRFYVDAGSGAIVATRTRFWRFYDWMWGLHIMDLQTREESHHGWIVGFGLLALLTTVLALVLLPLSGRRRKQKPETQIQGNRSS